ncbi:hypothetical protein P280DRAFT_514424 [Massarina eburnea CBS 473.64]|uniref:Uncharacterized protein n=1 Tax=Massarina eburnea CBS 473.64 TaxID=1395130 RepID=A0A6A6SB01_9PLEO|nr:hypothetical protein P280DRAFT_514424 [Massarina eburnea CBS 473.64]
MKLLRVLSSILKRPKEAWNTNRNSASHGSNRALKGSFIPEGFGRTKEGTRGKPVSNKCQVSKPYMPRTCRRLLPESGAHRQHANFREAIFGGNEARKLDRPKMQPATPTTRRLKTLCPHQPVSDCPLPRQQIAPRAAVDPGQIWRSRLESRHLRPWLVHSSLESKAGYGGCDTVEYPKDDNLVDFNYGPKLQDRD